MAVLIQQRSSARQGRLQAVGRALFRWREHSGFGRLEAAVLALFCAVLALVLPYHEAWGDEAQAWMIARMPMREIVLHRLHYEGAPPLWHLLLHAFQRLGGTYAGIGWFGAAFAVAGIYVFLRWSPFPLIIRLLLPFTFFFQYQYAVIARSYTLFPLLVFCMCALFRRKQHVVWFAVTAGLLANLCLQGIIISFLLSALYVWELRRRAVRVAAAPGRRLAAALIFAASLLIACYTAIPAPDVGFAVTDTVSTGMAHRVLVKLIGETPRLQYAPPPLDMLPPPPPEPPRPRFVDSPSGWTAWTIAHHDSDAQGHVLPRPLLGDALYVAVNMLSQAIWPLATWSWLAVAFLLCAAVWLYQRGSLVALVPWLAIIVVGELLWVTDHHGGMILTALVAALWIGAVRRPERQAAPIVLHGMTGLMALVLALQVGWTVHCASADVHGSYDPAKETAAYMKAHPVARTAGFHFWSTSMQPYFEQNPFFNIPTRYWLWSINANPDPFYREYVDSHPDRIVYSVEFAGHGQMQNQLAPISPISTDEEQRTLPWDVLLVYFHQKGYVETHRFCGTRYARLSTSFVDCNLVLEPAPPAAP